MRAIDTNILVRFLIGDDERQFEVACQTVRAGNVFVATTVLLEAEWVLRSAYGLDRREIRRLMADVSGLPEVTVEDPRLLAEALQAMDRGVDFADALHVGRARDCEAFVTFDKALTSRAGEIWPGRVIQA